MGRVGIVVAGVLATVLLALPGPAAAADFAVSGFSIAPDATGAGTHPDVDLSIDFPGGLTTPRVNDLTIGLPPGLIGNPGAVPRCTQAQFSGLGCPGATQVGTTSATVLGLPAPGAVYNLEPGGDEPARLGVAILGLIKVQSVIRLRPSDGGLDAVITDLPDLQITNLSLTLSGTPGGGTPFMTLPTACVPATARVVARSDEASPVTASRTASFTPTGCGAVPFAPGAAIATETAQRGVPSGYSVTLTVPGDEEPVRQAHVRRAEVVLPAGTTLSPGVADGLDACTDAQFGLGGDGPSQCPASARIGSVTFATPLLPAPLTGTVSFAAATPGRPLGLFVAVDQAGVRLKLAGAVQLDPATGQITTVFDDLPQVPFTSFTLTFQGGPRAVLANPAGCGAQTMTARLTPWSGGAAVERTAAFTTDADGAGGACGAPVFRPALAVDVADRTAGRPAGAVTLRLSRPDGDAAIGRVVTDFPPGLAGGIAGVGICPEAQVPGGACPADSRVGSVTATVGSGSAPATLRGSVFLTGPAEGGLVGLAIVIPGKVGPIDLGTVVTRAGIVLRPTDGGLTVRTAELPRIVGGVPIAIRELALTLDRPGFMRNATSCEPLAVTAAFTSQGGSGATASAPYRAERCDALAFTPTISATLGGRGRTGPKAKPALTTVIAVPPGQAASRTVAVTLPAVAGVDLTRLEARCTAEQAAAGACPPASRIGAARAVTSLLPAPLTGDVYLADLPGAALPGLRVSFTSPVRLDLNGTVEFTPLGVKSTFGSVPDVPLERFELALDGGRSGALVLPTGVDLCRDRPPSIGGDFVAHSGATAAHREAVTIAGCGPRATLTLKRLRGAQPELLLRVRRDPAAAALRSVRMRLPKALRVVARKVRKGVSARGGGAPLAGSLTRKGVLTARAPKGAGTISVRVRKGAFRATRKLRARLGDRPRLAFRLAIADTAGARTERTLRLRARR